MIHALFNASFWYDIAILVLIGFIVFACIKYPQSRIYVFSFALVVLVAFTVGCGVQLNNYYKAEGGIFGYIQNISKPNHVEVSEQIFEFKDLVLVKDTNGNFSVEVYTDDVVNLDNKIEYELYVNNIPCSATRDNGDNIVGELKYTFRNDNGQTLLTDTLNIRIAFYKNNTYLKLYTSAGQTASDYWNNYVYKNGFKIEIKEKTDKNQSEVVSGDVSNFAKVTYIVDEEIYSFDVVFKNTRVMVLSYETDEDRVLTGWVCGNEIVESDSVYTVTDDVIFVGQFVKTYNVTFEYFDKSDLVKVPENESIVCHNVHVAGYELLGWAKKGTSEIIDISTYPITEDTVFVAQFVKTYMVNYVIDGRDYFSESVRINEFATYTAPSMMGYKFDYWVKEGTNEIVDISSYPITEDITLVAVFSESSKVSLNLEFTSSQRNSIYKNGALWSKGGQVEEIVSIVYVRDVGTLEILLKCFSVKEYYAYYSVPVDIDNIDELTNDFVYNVFIDYLKNLPIPDYPDFYIESWCCYDSINNTLPSYFEENINSRYEINGVVYSLNEIKNLCYCTSHNIFEDDYNRTCIFFSLLLLKDGEIPVVTEREVVTICENEDWSMEDVNSALIECLEKYKIKNSEER